MPSSHSVCSGGSRSWFRMFFHGLRIWEALGIDACIVVDKEGMQSSSECQTTRTLLSITALNQS